MMTDTVDKNSQPLHSTISTSASNSPSLGNSGGGEREGRTRDPDNEPPYSRIFVVCGKATADKDLEAEFQPFGNVQYCKVIRDKKTGESKGIAYIKYEKASAAAKAIEEMNSKTSAGDDQVVYKVMIAEAKTANRSPAPVPSAKSNLSKEPEDQPPRSRLFIVCPKDYTEDVLTQKFAPYGEIEACKVIREKHSNESKGYAYVKFTKSSSAAVALEEINKNSEKEGVPKLKVLIAEPKSKNKTEIPMPISYPPMAVPMPYSYGPADIAAYPIPPFIPPRQRLFVVCHKSVTQDQLSRLFSRFPGMEYCDVKKNKTTGESKGFAYINYSTPQAAHMAKEQMDLYDFPAGSPLRVMIAEPLGVNKNAPSEPASITAIRDSFAQMMTYPLAYPPATHPAVNVAATHPHAHPHAHPIPTSSEASSPSNKTNDRNFPEGSRLFIVLSKALPDYMLQDLFSRYGALEYVRLQKDKNYGYAKYTTASAAQVAMSYLNNQEFHGQKITITIAHPPNTDSRKRPRI